MEVFWHSEYGMAVSQIKEYEVATTSKYTPYYKEAGFNQTSLSAIGNKRIWWEDAIVPYTGVPYVLLGTEVLECHHGPDRHKKDKKNTYNNEFSDHSYCFASKGRLLVSSSKKLDCPSKIHLKAIIRFPEFKIDGSDSKSKRKRQALKLRTASFDKLLKEYCIVLCLPDIASHKNHLTGEFSGFSQPVDQQVKDKIIELVFNGVRKVSEMKRHLEIYVKEDLQLEVLNTNRRFFPSDRDIRNHMYLALSKTRFSKNDQLNLQSLINQWSKDFPNDCFFLRLSSEKSSQSLTDDEVEESVQFLFVYQAEWQKRLINLYGGEICLLDATYNTSKYDLPLFFVCVNTNVGYSVVASFIIANENRTNIKEAIGILKQWNTSWKPKFFMCDFDLREIWALETSFEDCHVYLCDFHREQAWGRWLRELRHQCSEEKDEVIKMLRTIANADCEDQCQDEINTLRNSEIYKSKDHLRNWLEKKWLPNCKRWAQCYRRTLFNIRVNTTNGLERQHKELKENYLSEYIDRSLTNMVTTMIMKYLPDSYKRYTEYNIKSLQTYRKYSPDVPLFLIDKPRLFVDHCIQRIPPQVQQLHLENLEEISKNHIKVKSVDSDNIYMVDLESELPNCSCPDWKKTHWPCKHILAILNFLPGYRWESLPLSYINSPHFNLDLTLLESSKVSLSNADVLTYQKQNCIENDNELEDLEPVKITVHDKSLSGPLQSCLNHLKSIEANIYCIADITILHDLEKALSAIAVKTNEETPKSSQLPIRRRIGKSKKPKSFLRKGKIMNRRSWTAFGKRPTFGIKNTRAKKKRSPPLQSFRTQSPKSNTLKTDTDKFKDFNCNKGHGPSLSDIDQHNASVLLKKIWSLPVDTYYIIAKVHNFNVTDLDIRSLRNQQWLTDQIVDACLAMKCQAEIDQGRKILHISAQIMTSICKGNSLGNRNLFRKDILTTYDVICGVYNQNGNHWDLVVLTPPDGRFHFYNPMGFQGTVANQVLNNWREFLEERRQWIQEKDLDLILYCEKHAIQTDGFNCGVYCLMFAERILSYKPLTGISYQDVQDYRRRTAESVLMYEVYMRDACPCCGCTKNSPDDIMIECILCKRSFHKKAFCVGETLFADDSVDEFFCKMCDQEIVVPASIDLCGKGVTCDDADKFKKPIKLEKRPSTSGSDPVCTKKMKTSVSIMTNLQVKGLVKSKFSDLDIEIFLQYLASVDSWSVVVETLQEVKKVLKPLGDVQRVIKEENLIPLGQFGDGYMDNIPIKYIKDFMYPVKLTSTTSWTVFGGLSLQIFGHEQSPHLLRLHVICYEVEKIERDQKDEDREMVMKELQKDHTTTYNEEEVDLALFHLRYIPEALKFNIIVHACDNGKETTKNFTTDNPKATIHLLALQLFGDNFKSFLPFVDGIFFDKSISQRKICGAKLFGFCQGDSQEYAECQKCFQSYHRQCVGIGRASFECGCHIKRPYISKNIKLYSNGEMYLAALKKTNISKLKQLKTNIRSERNKSVRWKTFTGSNSKQRQHWKDKNNSLLSKIPSYLDVLEYIKLTLEADSAIEKELCRDVYTPEIIVFMVQQMEGFNRLQAELFLQQD